ncbi:hypothetical protein ACPRNU_22575 [Chromobacterium vaccinii]|uniref:hypothetical protein n=1 Tax=Chromobacterium vaccinii TaxID=1108595 RepID=UPI003C7428CB
MSLPNPSRTWGKPIETFEAWHARVQPKGANPETDQLLYLTEQLREEGNVLREMHFNHPLLGLLSQLSEQMPRTRELLYAYLAYVVADDAEPMQRAIAGQRLQPDLHPEYVTATACYGPFNTHSHSGQRPNPDAAVAAIRFALKSDEGLPFLECWLHGQFDVIRKEWPEAPAAVFQDAETPSPTESH